MYRGGIGKRYEIIRFFLEQFPQRGIAQVAVFIRAVCLHVVCIPTSYMPLVCPLMRDAPQFLPIAFAFLSAICLGPAKIIFDFLDQKNDKSVNFCSC